MNGAISRDLLAQAVIVIAACTGAWFMFVEPRQSEAARLEDLLRAGNATSQKTPDALMESGLEQVAEIKAILHAIQEASGVAGDYTHLYDLMMKSASQAGINVRSVTPVAQEGRYREDEPVRVVRIEVLIDGAYESVAAFVDRVCENGRTIRLTRLSLSPLNNTVTPQVAATIAFDAYAFELPNNLETLIARDDNEAEGAGDANPD